MIRAAPNKADQPQRLGTEAHTDQHRPDRLGPHQQAGARCRGALHRPELREKREDTAGEPEVEHAQPFGHTEVDRRVNETRRIRATKIVVPTSICTSVSVITLNEWERVSRPSIVTWNARTPAAASTSRSPMLGV